MQKTLYARCFTHLGPRGCLRFNTVQFSKAPIVCTVFKCVCAVSAATCKGFILLHQQTLSHKMHQLAESHNVCLWLLCGTGGGEVAQIILQNRKTKETESTQREGMSNARRLLNRSPGRREREGERNESGSEREWQWMYLSRSQIINRDSVVWIERKRGESGGEKESVSMGKEGWVEWWRWGGASENRRWYRVKVEERGEADGWGIIL